MQTIQKFKLTPDKVQRIQMPKKAEILRVGLQYPTLCDPGIHMWALVETNNKLVYRCFLVATTGEDLDKWSIKGKHIETVDDEGIIFHVFDLGEEAI